MFDAKSYKDVDVEVCATEMAEYSVLKVVEMSQVSKFRTAFACHRRLLQSLSDIYIAHTANKEQIAFRK